LVSGWIAIVGPDGVAAAAAAALAAEAPAQAKAAHAVTRASKRF
jgi:hypothetical protein